jgi:hypothetical protein
MKKILFLCVSLLCLGACASVPRQSCSENLARPYFFTQGEKIAAFRINLMVGAQQVDGILQIKKTGDEKYDATLFSTAGAYRLLQATLTREGTQYTFLIPAIDRSAVHIRTERFLSLLLFPSKTRGSCKIKTDGVQVNYKHAPMSYVYESDKNYPHELIGPKSFGRVYLTFADYQPYEGGQLPHKLHYKDGKVQADLTLLRLKK